jgi:hypothetical protein
MSLPVNKLESYAILEPLEPAERQSNDLDLLTGRFKLKRDEYQQLRLNYENHNSRNVNVDSVKKSASLGKLPGLLVLKSPFNNDQLPQVSIL